MKKQKACLPEKRGSGLIFAVILLFVILAMVITLSSITVLETKMGQKTKSSIGAFYNSESGVEWALNKIANGSGPNVSDVFSGFSGGKIDCPSGFGCSVYLLDDQAKVIVADVVLDNVKAVRSVGTQGDSTQRAIEAAVAAGGSVSFTYYCFHNSNKGGTPVCADSGGAQGHCPSGFIQKLDLGTWGECTYYTGIGYSPYDVNHDWFRPPGATCSHQSDTVDMGDAYICSQ